MITWLIFEGNVENTVKPVLSGNSKIDKIKVLNGSLMKVERIAECSL